MFDKIGLFIAEDAGVILVDSIGSGQSGQDSEGPDDQKCSIVEISGVLKRFPICVHIRAWKHKVALVHF